MKYLLIIPFLLTLAYAQDRVLFRNDTLIVSIQYLWTEDSDVTEVVHVSERLFNQVYTLRVAKYEVQGYHPADSFEIWNLGGKQVLYLEQGWLFLCEDDLYGLRCINYRQ